MHHAIQVPFEIISIVFIKKKSVVFIVTITDIVKNMHLNCDAPNTEDIYSYYTPSVLLKIFFTFLFNLS